MSNEARARNLVSTKWLADHLNAPDIAIVDASWYLPAMNRNGRAEYDDNHIPGAVFFDLEEISDTDRDLPHMLPSATKFASRVRAMGIGDGQQIIVYDGAGIFSAPRVWWMFKVMGARDVAVLDGGLPKWITENRQLDDRPVRRMDRHFTVQLDNTAIRDRNDVGRISASADALILDARGAARFAGSEPEPRPGLRSGHIPHSRNLPFGDLLNPDATFKPNELLAARFSKAGWSRGSAVTTTCGSGVTAAILTLALTLLGETDLALYDGSWADWGMDQSLPIETGL